MTVGSYKQFCPVAMAAEILCTRWTVVLLRELIAGSTRFNELQWQLQDATEALHETMKASTVNEQLALSQLDKILDGEREIKRAHMELAIRIKNKLTPDQQTKLQSMKKERGPGEGPGGRARSCRPARSGV